MGLERWWRTRRGAVPLVLVLALNACGDAPSDDNRGYTKAPLENPGLTIESETPTPMASLGDPILRPPARVASEDSAS